MPIRTPVFRRLSFIGIAVLALVLGWGLGASYEREALRQERDAIMDAYAGSGSVISGDPAVHADISLLWEVWRTLQHYYISPEKLTSNTMIFGAASGMVESLGDPYTVFMTPSENKEFINGLQGELEGIGAELTMKEDAIVVVAPLKNSPAEKAGLLPQDIIVTVDGQDVSGLRLDQVIMRIRGEAGTSVMLEIYRDGEDDLLEMAITRARIHIPSIETDVFETSSGTLAYLALNRFDDELTGEIERALTDFPDDIDGLILDVRFNGGGLLDSAVEVASFFLKEGKVVTVERRGADADEQFVSGRPLMPDVPMVVLINEGSASASEILAGALQDHGRATVIGKQSFGKGTVQEIVDLPGGASMRVTTARWLTPNGLDLGKTGITPDIEVDRTSEQIRNDEDPQLERAKEVLLAR